MLYNAPRAATIISKTDSIMFSLDRGTFTHIVKDSASKQRERYETFLSSVEILQDIEPYERSQIADAIKSQKFKKGEYILREGDYGEIFYILEEGEAVATKMLDGKEKEVLHYTNGQYFGEIALLKSDSKRAANVVAKTDLKACTIDRKSFKRLLGPLESILKRNFKKYERFIG